MSPVVALTARSPHFVHSRAALRSRNVSRPIHSSRQTPAPRQALAPAAGLDGAGVEDDLADLVDEPIFEDASSPSTGLSTQQVSSVLSMLCEETDIMQIELKMGDFELYAQRSIKGSSGGASPASFSGSSGAGAALSPPPAGQSFQENMGQPQAPPPNPTQSVMTVDEDVDESMIFIESPKVGVFRRGRYAKGKRVGKGNVCEPGDEVKKGQTLAYVEQLGTFVPVESPQAGQIATFSCDEGESVEYKQSVIELAPFFGGHIIGESKWN
ncbi:hypothetical protein WJX84_009247 [Apatococcus fuscideae]|uniref:Lipoyl-binding domain-containing protein n=1 Tax=Apatococcus fuscideae TaxID=2026836 RepID=A0AAW1RP17_9CHLO